MNGQEVGTGAEFGEFGEFGEIGEFGELSETGEFGETEFGETGEFGEFGEAQEFGEAASPLNEAQEVELASELLEISSEEELEQFLGGLFKKVARGVGGFIKSPVGRALGGVLKSVAKKALPVVGGALGSMVAPGVGTAIGSKLGSMASGLFEVELESLPQEQAEYEVARRYVNLAAGAARNAALAKPRPSVDPRTVARVAVAKAARTYAPGLYRSIAPSLKAGIAAGRATVAAPVRRAVAAARPGGRLGPRGYGGAAYCPPAFDTGAGFGYGGGDGVPSSGRWVRRGRKLIVIGA